MEYFVQKRLHICCSTQSPPGSLFSSPSQQPLPPKFYYFIQPHECSRIFSAHNLIMRIIKIFQIGKSCLGVSCGSVGVGVGVGEGVRAYP
jgi:hypothetical protein